MVPKYKRLEPEKPHKVATPKPRTPTRVKAISVKVDDYPEFTAVLITRGPEQSEVRLSDGRTYFIPNSHISAVDNADSLDIPDFLRR